MSVGLGREDIRALLDDLSDESAARGARADLFLVGGAAIAVAHDEARSTRDLDAVRSKASITAGPVEPKVQFLLGEIGEIVDAMRDKDDTPRQRELP